MPPKVKHLKSEWYQCCNCTTTFSSRDLKLHAGFCSDDKPFSYRNVDFQSTIKHGFVVGDVLVGVTQQKTESPENLPSSYHDNVVLMSADTMRLLGVCIGHPALLAHSVCVTAWPDRSLALTTVAMSPALTKRCHILEDGFPITVQKLDQPPHIATQIRIQATASIKLKSKDFNPFCKRKLKGRVLTVGNDLNVQYFGQNVDIVVTKITDETGRTSSKSVNDDLVLYMQKLSLDNFQGPQAHFVSVDERTTFTMESEEDVKEDMKEEKIEQLGGLDVQMEEISDMIRQASSSGAHHLPSPCGVLLYGPPGTGKSCMLKTIAGTIQPKRHVINISGPEIWSKYHGESESRLVSLFSAAKQQAPSLLLLDNLEAICPRRDKSNNEVEKRVVASLLTLIDSLSGTQVFLLAATSSRDSLDPAIRRPGRLDREIELGAPNAKQRADILKCQLANLHNGVKEQEVEEVAANAHGFVGADLQAVCKQAGLLALKRDGNNPSIHGDDLQSALRSVQPSAMREVAIEVPNVTWKDIGGQHELKHKLKQAIEWPLKHPEAFERLGIRPPRGLLMYGPPGCSKTMIAKALAREGGINFVAIKGPELFSKWVGESERAVREVFRRARAAAPAIIFFDEIDALAGERGSGAGDVSDRVLAQLLTEIDGVDALKDVTIVAATNRPDRIDKALLRPGRLDRIVYVPLPDADTRREIFTIQLSKTPTHSDVNVEELVEKTHRYSGAEISAVCHEAALCAMQEDVMSQFVSRRHFAAALEMVTPRITDSLVKFYDDYASQSGLHSV